jgi:hypothetical protein
MLVRKQVRIYQDIETNEPHDCPVWRSSQQLQQQPQEPQQQQSQQSHQQQHQQESDIINVAKAAVRKSISMQMTRAKAVNTFR